MLHVMRVVGAAVVTRTLEGMRAVIPLAMDLHIEAVDEEEEGVTRE